MKSKSVHIGPYYGCLDSLINTLDNKKNRMVDILQNPWLRMHEYEPATLWQSEDGEKYAVISVHDIMAYFKRHYKKWFPFASITEVNIRKDHPTIKRFLINGFMNETPDYVLHADGKYIAVFVNFLNPYKTRLKYKEWYLSVSKIRLLVAYLYEARLWNQDAELYFCLLSNMAIDDKYLELLAKAGIMTIPICNSFLKKTHLMVKRRHRIPDWIGKD